MAFDPKFEQFVEECGFAKVVLMENDEEALLIGGRVIRLADSRFADYLSRALRQLSPKDDKAGGDDVARFNAVGAGMQTAANVAALYNQKPTPKQSG